MSDPVLSEYAETFNYCAICWSERRLHVHHMQGGAARVHVRENLLRLCSRCHENLHGHGGKDCITKGHCLTAKLHQDPEYYSPGALAALRNRKGLSYELAPLPDWVFAERAKNGRPRFREDQVAINSKTKGKRGELEAAAAINAVLPHAEARRSVQYSGTGGASDVTAPGLKNIWIEVKRVERLNIHQVMEKALEQCGALTPIVVHRRNKEEWLLTIRLEDVKRFVKGVT